MREKNSSSFIKDYEFIISTAKEILCSGKGYEYKEINLTYLDKLCSTLEFIKQNIDNDKLEQSLTENEFLRKVKEPIRRSSSCSDLEKSRAIFKSEADYISSLHFRMYTRGRGLEESGYEACIVKIVSLMIDLKPSLIYEMRQLLLGIKSEGLKEYLQKIVDNPNIIKENYLRHSR